MKVITAIIKPFKLDDVVAALREVGVEGVTVREVRGFGRQSGHSETYRGAEYRVNYIPKLHIDIAVDDADADRVVGTLREAASTGTIGDGKIWVTSIERITRVRTGEEGTDAL